MNKIFSAYLADSNFLKTNFEVQLTPYILKKISTTENSQEFHSLPSDLSPKGSFFPSK